MSEASALARLRVAQATHTPRTVADIVPMLAADDDASSLNAERVQEILDEWVAAGVVEQLLVEGDAPARYLIARVFENDIERRLVGNLSQPRTVESLQAITRTDPQVGQFPVEHLNGMLAALADRGLVKRLGAHDSGASLVRAARDDEDVIDLPREKAAALRERLDLEDPFGRRPRAWQLDGEQWCMTKFAADALAVT